MPRVTNFDRNRLIHFREVLKLLLEIISKRSEARSFGIRDVCCDDLVATVSLRERLHLKFVAKIENSADYATHYLPPLAAVTWSPSAVNSLILFLKVLSEMSSVLAA